jgi:hypothetical protein
MSSSSFTLGQASTTSVGTARRQAELGCEFVGVGKKWRGSLGLIVYMHGNRRAKGRQQRLQSCTQSTTSMISKWGLKLLFYFFESLSQFILYSGFEREKMIQRCDTGHTDGCGARHRRAHHGGTAGAGSVNGGGFSRYSQEERERRVHATLGHVERR